MWTQIFLLSVVFSATARAQSLCFCENSDQKPETRLWKGKTIAYDQFFETNCAKSEALVDEVVESSAFGQWFKNNPELTAVIVIIALLFLICCCCC